MGHLEEVRYAAEVARGSREQHLDDVRVRNARIRTAKADGVARAALSKASGLSAPHIDRICREER